MLLIRNLEVNLLWQAIKKRVSGHTSLKPFLSAFHPNRAFSIAPKVVTNSAEQSKTALCSGYCGAW